MVETANQVHQGTFDWTQGRSVQAGSMRYEKGQILMAQFFEDTGSGIDRGGDEAWFDPERLRLDAWTLTRPEGLDEDGWG